VSTAIVIAIVIALGVVAFLAYRSYAATKEAERQRARRDASDHRQQAEAGAGRAKELGEKSEHHEREARRHQQLAEEHGNKAEEHAREAAKAEGGKRRAGQAAGRHDERAAELEEKI
jgi:flagellar biosynthesis/type III secretory pathway M-ring protein FliF/YscJ